MNWEYSDEFYKEYTRKTWNETADHYDVWLEILAGLDETLIGALDLEPGDRVLDMAPGPGQPALKIAGRVGPEGSVLGVDLTPRMVERATEAAAEAGIDNVEFVEGDAEDLDLDDDTFDAVVCRSSLQIMTDPDAAVAEAHRVLEPGGRFAATVWAAPGEDSPLLHAIVGPMLEHCTPDEDGYIPTPYEIGGEGQMTAMLEAAGFSDVTEERRTVEGTFAVADEFIAAMLDGTPLGPSLQEEDEEVQEAVIADTRENLAAHEVDGELRLTGVTVVVWGTA